MLQIYKASAGSGKTYTLAREYIRSLLGIRPGGSDRIRLNHPKYVKPSADTVCRHRFILAITFTNKATEEMKRRIIGELDALSKMPVIPPSKKSDDANYSDLTADFGCSREDLSQAAGAALQQLLHDYGNFQVSTIDSFFQRVLRTFARELDRQGDYSVELDSCSVMREAVDRMIDDFNIGAIDDAAAKSLASWITSYINRKADEGKNFSFFNRSSTLYRSLVSFVSKIGEEEFKKYYDSMRRFLSNHERIPALEKEIDRLCHDMVRQLADRVHAEAALLQAAGFTPESLGTSVLKRFLSDNIEKCTLPSTEDITKRLPPIADGSSSLYTRGTVKRYPEWHAGLMRISCDMLETWCKVRELTEIRDALAPLGLLSYVWEYVDRFLSENNILLLEDTGHLLSRIINDDDAPFVYERMGVRLRHFLIDEFQDTSKLQWSNLRPLVANSMSRDNDNLIIGDEKQSIYRFRNSDSSLLHSVVETRDFPKSRYNTKTKGKEKSENTNYRSSRDVVEFNNTLFSLLAETFHADDYANVVQGVAPDNADFKGYVHFMPVSKDGAQDTEVIDRMAADIKRQHDEGGYNWGDIAVLVRTNSEGESIVDHLMHFYPEIPLVSEEAQYLAKNSAVQRVVGTLKLIERFGAGRREDPDARYINITPAEVSVVAGRFEYFSDAGDDDCTAIDRAIQCFSTGNDDLSEGVARIMNRHPSTLPALVETVIHEQFADSTSGQVAFLSAFQDLVIDYCSRYTPSLTAFLKYWDGAKTSATIPASVDVRSVRVMTVHKAKGLEFKCVHIPFGSWTYPPKIKDKWLPFPKIDGLDDEKCPETVFIGLGKFSSYPFSLFYNEYAAEALAALSDTLNLMYVAYTRAEAELTVYYSPEAGTGTFLSDAFAHDVMAKWRGPAEHELTIGQPTRLGDCRKSEKKECESNIRRTIDTLVDYDVEYHPSVIMRLHNVLELEADIDDEDVTATDGLEVSPVTADEDVYADDESRMHGIVMHLALSRINTAADVPRAVSVAAREFSLPAERCSRIEAWLRKMLAVDAPEVKRWFAPGADVVCEQTIFDPKSVQARRPDRVVFNTDGSVEVVDYKFTSEISPRHEAQVREYVSLLKTMGYPRVCGFLWYPFLKTPVIKQV